MGRGGAALKSCPITFAKQGKPAQGEAKRSGLSGARQNYHPYFNPIYLYIKSVNALMHYSYSALLVCSIGTVAQCLKWVFFLLNIYMN